MITNILRVKGPQYVLKKSFYKLFFPYIRSQVKNKSFDFNNQTYLYSNHKFETGHSTERCVEIPLIQSSKSRFDNVNILEIGNVLSHCINTGISWDVIDKYEVYPGVINKDIVSYKPGKTYNFIFSISTFEHIGFDEDDKNPDKIKQCISHVIDCLLAPEGIFLVTVPLGWNDNLDEDIRNHQLPFHSVDIIHRKDWAGNWIQIPLSQAEFKYGKFIGADYLAVLEYRKPGNDS